MFSFFHQLFLPHHKNNHRARLLHHSSLVFVFAALIIGTVVGIQVKNKYSNVLGISYSISVNDLLNLTNKMREKNGLADLTLNSQLSQAASAKADDMFAKNYWAHFAPDGSTTPWMFIKNSGYDYLYAGENLAKGFTDANSVVTAWMNSPTHRENLLSPKYKDIGFAVKQGKLTGEDTVLVVQMFGSLDEATPQTSNNAVSDVNGAQTAQEYIPMPQDTQLSHDNNPSVKSASLINIHLATKTILVIVFGVFLLTFALDILIIEKKKLPRIVGHNLDHIILIAAFLLFIVLQSSGGIL